MRPLPPELCPLRAKTDCRSYALSVWRGLEITFDPAKSERNRSERGFGFGYAARIFLARPVITPDKVIGGEARMKAVGRIEGEFYAVVFADRGDVRRIISARAASRKERREWPTSE